MAAKPGAPTLVSVPAQPARPAGPEVLDHAAEAIFGAMAIAAEIVARALDASASGRVEAPDRAALAATGAADTLLGVGWGLAHSSRRVLRVMVRPVAPVIGVLLRPPFVPARLTPQELLRRSTEQWVAARPEAIRSFTSLSGALSPTAAEVVGNLVHAEVLVIRVLQRLNLDLLAEALLDQLDMDKLVARMVADLDVDLVVQEILENVDLTALVSDVLSRLDTSQLELDNVDLAPIVDAVLAGIDIPRIVRESSGSMASESVEAVRLQGISADRAVSRVADRLLRRGSP